MNDIIIATNQAFIRLFEDCVALSDFPTENLINNNSDRNGNRLGGCRDLAFTIKQKQINDDLLVIAGDTLFNFDLLEMLSKFQNIPYDLIAYYPEK